MPNHDLEPNAAPSAGHPASRNDHDSLEAESAGGLPPAPAAVPAAAQEPASAGPPAPGHRPPPSDRRREANRLNAQKSTGPRTEAGKLRSSQNARLPVRLLGLADARTLNQDVNAAGKLYREMIAPYEPAPPLLARQFEDLARLYLELEGCERIRDAQLEDRWQQSDIARRQAFFDMERDLQGSAEELFKQGLRCQPDSPARSRKQAECLEVLKDHLTRRDFDFGPALTLLYGERLQPASDRALTICIRCAKLMDPGKRPSVSQGDFEELLDLVELELRDALFAYGLRRDEKTVTRAGRLARLAPGREDHWMNRHLERLRHDIDRKLKLILTLLEMYGFEQRPRCGRPPRLSLGSGAPADSPQAGPNTDSNADSDASSDRGSDTGSNAGADGRPGRTLPPRKPARRSHPVRRRAKKGKSRRHGRMAVAGGCRSTAVACRPLTHPPKRVPPLPAGEGKGVQEVAADGRVESQPSSSLGCRRAPITPSGVCPLPREEGLGVTGICSPAKKRSVRASKGVRCAQEIFERNPRSTLQSTNRSKNGTKRSQPRRWPVIGWRRAGHRLPVGGCRHPQRVALLLPSSDEGGGAPLRAGGTLLSAGWLIDSLCGTGKATGGTVALRAG